MSATPAKQKVLSDVGTLVKSGDVTLKELEDTYRQNVPEGVQPETPAPQPERQSRPSSIATALYVVGTVIVCIGVYLLISQNWNLMNTPVRILMSLGLGLGVFAAALYRARGQADVNHDLLASSLFTIGSMATSIGVGVVVEETVGDVYEPATITGIAIVLSGLFTILYLKVVRSLVLVYFAVAALLVGYYAAIEWATADLIKTDWFYPLISVFAGLILIGVGLSFNARALVSRLSDTLYALGAITVLGSAFWLSFAWNPSGNGSSLLYDTLYPFLLAAGVWLSVYVRSRAVLIVTAFFLTCYIIKLSAVYFADFLGGSLALLLAGALVIGMAYGTTRFAKRYIAR